MCGFFATIGAPGSAPSASQLRRALDSLSKRGELRKGAVAQFRSKAQRCAGGSREAHDCWMMPRRWREVSRPDLCFWMRSPRLPDEIVGSAL
jgi:hypothetical protein